MELYQLCSILEKLAKVDDCRVYLRQFIHNNKVNFEKASRVLSGIKTPERPISESPSESDRKENSPSPPKAAAKVQFTKDERKPEPKIMNLQDYKTTDERNKVNKINIMMNTWMSNKNTEDNFKKYTMLNQYKAMGLQSMNTDMQRMLSNTLNSQMPQGRNQADREHKRSTSKKHSRTAAHSAHSKRSNSRRKKSPIRGRNDNSFGVHSNQVDDSNTFFLNMIKNSLKSKHKNNENSMNVSRGRDNTINSMMPQTMSHIGRTSVKKSRSKNPQISSSPKRATIKYSKTLGRTKGGSTRVSRKGSTATSKERGVYISQRTSPKSKGKKSSLDYNSGVNSGSFKFSNIMKDMGVMNNYNQQSRPNVRSRQGVIGSKKSSMIDSMIGNATKARERAQKMYTAMGVNIHTPTPSNDGLLFNDSKRGAEILMMGANNNHHQHIYKVNSTGRGKTPHQKQGSVKRRKPSGSGKRSHSRPRSSKNSGAGKQNAFQAKFFDPKLMMNTYNM